MARIPAMNDVVQRWCVGDQQFPSYAEALARAMELRQGHFSKDLSAWIRVRLPKTQPDGELDALSSKIASALIRDFDIRHRKSEPTK